MWTVNIFWKKVATVIYREKCHQLCIIRHTQAQHEKRQATIEIVLLLPDSGNQSLWKAYNLPFHFWWVPTKYQCQYFLLWFQSTIYYSDFLNFICNILYARTDCDAFCIFYYFVTKWKNRVWFLCLLLYFTLFSIFFSLIMPCGCKSWHFCFRFHVRLQPEYKHFY